ncbi:hypothetical protein DW886_21485 [Enterocloster aldenensis]|uniref:hypothetical protein n=1 Tax=Enterocloster aldenensis TaxID=358742 RepID=UPI000E4A066A|nr:hypothetical protein DW886_21485 [Enterocloster aldenensis]
MNKIIERLHIEIAVYKSASTEFIRKKKELQMYDNLSRGGVFRFLWMDTEITTAHKAYLMEHYPQLKEMLACVREFREIYQRKLKEIARFAKGIEKDLSAMENSVASPLSNVSVKSCAYL